MTGFGSTLVGLGSACALIFGSSGAVVAGSVMYSGMVHIKVHERGPDGVNLNLPVPAAFLEAGLASASGWIPASKKAEIESKLAPYQGQLDSLFDQLEAMPDAVLVAVDSDKEQVRIEKQGRNLRITVHSEQEDVEISLPVGSLGRMLDTLAEV
jgi:hypothetical protein